MSQMSDSEIGDIRGRRDLSPHRSAMSVLYHPIPVQVSYGRHIDPSDLVFGFHEPSLAIQIAIISFQDLTPPFFYDQPQKIIEKRVNVAISAVNLRQIKLPADCFIIFKKLAAGIPHLNNDSHAGPSTIWPDLHTLDFSSRYPRVMSAAGAQNANWIIASIPALERVTSYLPAIAPKYVPNGLAELVLTVRGSFSSSILQSKTAAASLRTLTLDGADTTQGYDQSPAFRSMGDTLLAAAPALLNLRNLSVRGFGPKNYLADALVAIVALPSLRTVRLLIIGEGNVHREAALLTRILDATNIGLHTLGLICITSPVQRRGPLPSFVLDILAKAKLPCLRTISYAARRLEAGLILPPLSSRPNVRKLKRVCILRRVKLEVIELEPDQTWP